MKKTVFLDYASTTPVKKEVLDYAKEIMESEYYNPSSSYTNAKKVREIIEKSRKNIADEIGANPNEIIFTSGASESNTLAIKGYLENHNTMFCTSEIEHSSISKIKTKCWKTTIGCDNNGFIDCNKNMPIHFYGGLYSFQFANNEIGVIQDMKKLCETVKNADGIIHTDATQSFGHIKIDVNDLGIDMLSASAHKIGGLKGCGFLYVRDGIKIDELICGSQENGIRGGTYNTVGIAAFGKAVELINYNVEKEIQNMRNSLLKDLIKINGVHINGSLDNRLPNNINIMIKNISIDSQQLVSLLDMHGFMVSSGSACNSFSTEPSYVLKAIGLSDYEANHSIRITIGEENTKEELNDFIKCLKYIIEQFKI